MATCCCNIQFMEFTDHHALFLTRYDLSAAGLWHCFSAHVRGGHDLHSVAPQVLVSPASQPASLTPSWEPEGGTLAAGIQPSTSQMHSYTAHIDYHIKKPTDQGPMKGHHPDCLTVTTIVKLIKCQLEFWQSLITYWIFNLCHAV